MPTINTRANLKNYCLRRLGYPVIKINVSDDQIEDRLDDAFDFFNEFHYDSTARFFHKYQITETDVANQYLTIPNEITHIRRILPLSSDSSNSEAIFDPVYQMHMNDFLSFSSAGGSLQTLFILKQHMKMMDMQLNGAQQEIDFSRYEHQLRLRVDWSKDISVGQWIIVDAERLLLDPDDDYTSASDVYNDQFLKEYATALIKLQWGQNLSKFDGVQLPGGVTYNGERITSEAKEDLQRIREDARNVWEEPLGIYTG